jgi:hypothetical protein
MTLREIAVTKSGDGGKIADHICTHLETHFGEAMSYIDQPSGNPDAWCLNDIDREKFLSCAMTKFKVNGNKKDKDRSLQEAMRETAAKSFDANAERKCSLKHKQYDGHVLGRVTSEDRLIKIIDEILVDINVIDHNASRQSSLKRLYEEDDLEKHKEKLKEICAQKNISLGEKDRVMWVWFITTSKDDPYQGLKGMGRGLLKQLGMTYEEEITVITWAHEVPEGFIVRYPTVLDAEFDPQWRPGGHTFPIGNKNDDYTGCLPEAVHLPVRADNLKKPIIKLEKL